MFTALRDILVGPFKVDPEKVTPEATLEQLGLDSLSVVELSLILEKDLGVRVSDDELLGTPTIGAMAELIGERGAPV
ncbi:MULTISPECIES: acyl carrier protein [unclassified Streptomyces]|jgi:acyl carrier protein|uniref:acyl carrier protein n=1 Tax=unclassified Streptomyces TaxID=2593676 RepID=UPI0004BF6733|nr:MULTISPECIES: acyl carrier protein [unclassified Streptomyces]